MLYSIREKERYFFCLLIPRAEQTNCWHWEFWRRRANWSIRIGRLPGRIRIPSASPLLTIGSSRATTCSATNSLKWSLKCSTISFSSLAAMMKRMETWKYIHQTRKKKKKKHFIKNLREKGETLCRMLCQETCWSIFPYLCEEKRKVFLSFVNVFISVGMEMDKVVKADQQVTAPPPQSCCRVCVCAGW